MASGEAGYLGLQENFENKIQQGNDVIANVVLPGKSQMLVFVSPRPMEIIRISNMMPLPLLMKTRIL